MTTPPAPAADDNDNGPDVDPPVVDDNDSGDPNADPTPTPPAPPRTTPPKAQDEPPLDLPDAAAGYKRALEAERKLRKDKERELAALAKKHASAEELALLQAREAASAETEGRIRPQLLRHIASAKLEAAGASGDTTRLVGLLDLDKVQLTEDGDLTGLDDQVVELKTEFPNLFVAPGVKPPVPKVNNGSGGNQGRKQDNSNQGGKPKTFADVLADRVLNPRA